MTIVNLRGTNGSGKSTVARALLGPEHLRQPAILAPYRTPKGAQRYVQGTLNPELDLIVVGPYRTDCGGCDAIKTQDLVKESVRIAATLARNVLFEGIIISTLYSGWATFAESTPFTWAYLDTPVELCLARIQERNGGKPIKENLVRDKHAAIERTRLKAVSAGHPTALIDHRRAAEQVRELFR